MSDPPAGQAFNTFIEESGLSNVDVARALSISKGMVSQIRSLASRPSDFLRFKIERWTGRRVRVPDWLTSSELQAIHAVTPFRRRPAPKAKAA